MIGAGPAGAATAIQLSGRPGLEVLLLDRATFPRRKVCGSGLSPWCLELLDQLDLGQRIRAEAFHIGAARIGGRLGGVIELRSNYEAAVLLRERFDHILVQEAVARGATLQEGVRVTDLLRDDKGTLRAIRTSEGEIEVDAAVVANGAKTTLHTHQDESETLHSFMGWFEGVDDVIDAVELYFDPVVKPYYGWVFPESLNLVNIGIVFAPTEEGPNAKERYHTFLEERLGQRMRHAEQIGKYTGHPIRVTHRPRALVEQGVLTAGEAGSLVDAATAEGIHHALASGIEAGKLLGQLHEEGQPFSAKALAPYEKRIQKVLGRRLMAGGMMRQFARTPMYDWMIYMGSSRPVRHLLTWMLAGA